MNIPGIYAIRHIETGRLYIGSSKNIRIRIKTHFYDLRKNQHHCAYLQNAWNKYGDDAFEVEVLEQCELDRTVLLEREQHYLDTLKPEFNHLPTAGSRLGSKASDETRAKQSASMKGKLKGIPKSPEHREKLKEVMRDPSDETRAKMRAAKLGRTVPDETKRKMAEAHKGYQPSEESIEAMRRSKAQKRFEMAQDIVAGLKEQQEALRKNDTRRMLRTLSDEDVRAIRTSVEIDRIVAERFGVSQTTIGRIRRGVIYRDVV